MTCEDTTAGIRPAPVAQIRWQHLKERMAAFPWWLAAILAIVAATAMVIATRPNFQEAFLFIRAGLGLTVSTTLVAYLIALAIGLMVGLGRISSSVVSRNISTLYVEVVRGIPMLVLIFTIALVLVPVVVDGLNALGGWLNAQGLGALGAPLTAMQNKAVPMNLRAIIALSITYGAFLAEIFRAGIQSIGRGQMEAARSQGMTYWQAMRYIILPQAVRNVLPALGNDFISMLKDSSLVSVLAVRDITQVARLYAGQSFRYPESYTTLAVMYLSMTVVLSMLVKVLEKRYQQDGHNG